jgi:fatty acid desaturase
MTARTPLLRIAVFAGALVAAGATGHPALALAAALGLYLATFAFTHDVMHGAAGLGKRATDAWLVLGGALMGLCGHGMRILHLRHHARPLADDDIEGAGARLTVWGALREGPHNIARYRIEGLRAANARGRRFQIAETALTLILTVVALASRSVAGAAWVTVNAVMQLTLAAWASNLPHRPPRFLRAIALRLTWLKSPTLLSFAFHHAHHTRPKVPCAELASAICAQG